MARALVLHLLIATMLLAAASIACGGDDGYPVSATSTALPTQVSGFLTQESFTVTPGPDLIPNTLEEAIRLTASVYTGRGSNLHSARPDSVTYVLTTAGAADAFFRPNRVNFENVREETPAWVFVAHGEFVLSAAGVGGTPVPLSTAWIVILKDVYVSLQSGYSNQDYDLSKLGHTRELPVSAYSQY